MIRKRELMSLGVAIDAVRSTLPDEDEARAFEGANHPPRGQIRHQGATTT